MYHELGAKICNCCGIPNCQCEGICHLVDRDIQTFKRLQCFTVSPNPKQYDNIPKLIEDWNDKFYSLCKHLSDGIFVIEMDGVRPHYHCVVDILDKVGFNQTLFCWSQYHNVKKHDMFKRGIHYLFKDVERTYEDIAVFPIRTYADYNNIRIANKAKRQEILLQNKKDRLDELNKDIPKCFK